MVDRKTVSVEGKVPGFKVSGFESFKASQFHAFKLATTGQAARASEPRSLETPVPRNQSLALGHLLSFDALYSG